MSEQQTATVHTKPTMAAPVILALAMLPVVITFIVMAWYATTLLCF